MKAANKSFGRCCILLISTYVVVYRLFRGLHRAQEQRSVIRRIRRRRHHCRMQDVAYGRGGRHCITHRIRG